MTNAKRRSPIRLVLALLVVLIVCVGAYAGLLYADVRASRPHIDAATASYRDCLAQIEGQHFQEALASAHATADEVAQIRAAYEGWEWDLAERLPYVGQDALCMRQSTKVADELATNAMLPVIEQAEDILGDYDENATLSTIGDTLSKLPGLYTSLADARKVVAACRTEAQTLPQAHLDGFNAWAGTVRTATDEIDEAFSALDVIIDTVDALSDLASSFAEPQETGIAG